MRNPTTLTRQLLATAAMLVWALVADRLTPGMTTRLSEVLRRNALNAADYEQMERGYYEQLLDTGWKVAASADVPKRGTGHGRICREVDDVRGVELLPNLLAMLPDGSVWGTNGLGMRDQPYSTQKPSETFRIALTGDSIGAGLGVDDGRGFEPTLERWLDRRSRGAGGPAVEILNFAVPGRSPGQRWHHFQKVAWALEPDLVLFEATQADVGWDERRLAVLLAKGVGWDSPLYRAVLARAGVRRGGTIEYYRQALRTCRWELLTEVYKAIAADCRARGVPSLWVLIPRVGRRVESAEHRRLLGLARAAGFTAVVDISNAYDGLDPASLAIGPDDYHPNAEGHTVLARRLDEALRQQAATVRIPGIETKHQERPEIGVLRTPPVGASKAVEVM